jgi:hypothetical protein
MSHIPFLPNELFIYHKNGKCLDADRTLLLQNLNDKDLSSHNFNNMDLPITRISLF